MVRMAVLEADSEEDSLEAVHLTETEALEMASRVENSKVETSKVETSKVETSKVEISRVETSKVECRAEIRATDIQTVPAVQL